MYNMNYFVLFFVFSITMSVYPKICHSESSYYYRSWSSSTTTRTFSNPTNKANKRCKASNNIQCPLKTSDDDQISKKIGNGINDNNCVLYLRDQRGINLPSKNLSSISSKISIINSHIPAPHCVAVIKTPGKNSGIGHLAEVISIDEINGKSIMRLSESNNPTRGYYERTITGYDLEEIEKKVNIAGYYIEPYQGIEYNNAYNVKSF